MKAILPGKPESRLQALATGFWQSRRVIAYITGSAIAILSDHDTLLQTIYDDDEQRLEAIAFDEASGKIAVCTDRIVRIYKPFGQEEDALRWALQSSFTVDDERIYPRHGDSPPVCLSWGGSDELLVARSSLCLYQTTETPVCTWRKPLPNPAKYASLSYDSAYISSVGYHDRLVKVWRRLGYGADVVAFDFAYLPHPQVVTSLQWRKPYHVDQTIDNVLFTICCDNILRIWTGSEGHGTQHLQLWGKVDLSVSSLENGPRSRHHVSWATIIQGRDFSAATETAVEEGTLDEEKDGASLEQLITVANRSPEICVAFDGRGQMFVWGMENITCRSQSPHNIFPIAQVSSSDFEFVRGRPSLGASSHVEIYSYCNKPGGHLNMLFHYFGGKIEFCESNIARLLSSEGHSQRLTLKCVWSGHSSPIKKMVRNFSGRAVVSRTDDGESAVWKHALSTKNTGLSRQTLIPAEGHIHRICVLRKGRFVIFLYYDRIVVWDCRKTEPSLLASCEYTIPGKPLCLLILPRQKPEDSCTAHIATITSEKRGIVWELKLPPYAPNTADQVNGTKQPEGSIREFFTFGLDDAGDLAYVLPVDPAGASPIISGFLDVFARDVAISYTHSGRVEFWTARVGEERVEWLLTSSMETGVNEPALVSGSTMKKAALVNSTRSTVTIWDIRGARLEYAREFESQNVIQDLDWTSTPDSQAILAVGFSSRVLLLSEMRFDYLNKGPAWAPVREISIRDVTPHPIGDSTWLGDGHLVVGAGNQFFVHDRRFDVSGSLIESLRLPHRKDGMWDLFDVVQRLNGPLPIFHPQFLSQCIIAGKVLLVHRILLALHKTLKFWVEGDTIDDYLGLEMEAFYTNTTFTSSAGASKESGSALFTDIDTHDDMDETFSEEVAQAINEKLTRIALPQLSGQEQIQLVDIIECVGLVEQQRRSMDENGARFMLFFRQHSLRKRRTNEMHMSWREINWAYHSISQDILVDFVSRQHHGTLLWETARESGMFMWLTDTTAVRAQFEIIARNEYTKSEMKNPVDCSLFYLALRKKAVLQGLWRMAGWNREQVATMRLLSNNFENPKWKTAALKNAYALLSKRRFEYATAFFLLADQLQDAVGVCLNQLKDLQLAIAITRVYEGDQGPVLRKLLEEEVLTLAAKEGNRWLASWAFWMLHRRDMAVRALITPVYTLLETPSSGDIKSKSFLTDDPALVILYSQLRQKTLQTLRGASKVTPKVEWEFVLHNARLYDRMGCDLLGLDLVRNWEFLRSDVTITPGLGGEINPLRLLKRRTSLVVDDMPTSPVAAKVPPDMKAGGGRPAQPPPTTFEEPDANSLLDSFGF
ncbi:Regulator of V-ATPase in vacuolar membrane protein 1 [Pleurostoma richardsiae]|uniref:Regulator of V-ATPase in vacuolar membrane protein 1 n=1 Tax=Pleurostoma richardsiae TaxID=41990 RepID=A0AA38VFV3_9PEZI|nr:Regulator of V-ATPase in vacuolar membrane protein 1 [Pleurostoma richardsiae]